ncbi:MAG TPA: ATP phosphoribosyltransferase regulatory subunit, partial [Pirellulales bacterium]|nr:ATP phosphoribosyltransferase regulatory subunit [Pirellulales bacterium]
TRASAADIETALVIHDLMRAVGFDDFTIRVNNRMVLAGLLERIGLAEQSTHVLRALDKLGKIGPEKVAAEMEATAGATAQQAGDVLKLAALSGGNAQVLAALEPLVAGSEKGQEGVARLAELLAAATAAGVCEERIRLDVSIARGLDYYTGTIFETFLDRLPTIGSVCSGGRYDNLAGLYTSQELPGIGASLGLDRLLAAMEELGMLPKVATPAEVFMPFFVEGRLHDYLRLAAQLRAAGLSVEFYPEPKRLGHQLKYADRRGFRVAVIIGEDEFARSQCQIKNLVHGETRNVELNAASQYDAVVAELSNVLRRIQASPD